MLPGSIVSLYLALATLITKISSESCVPPEADVNENN